MTTENKLVNGVGINDLGYRVHVQEDVTKNGGKRIRKSVFLCKYYTVCASMLERCYSKKKTPRKQAKLYWHERL